ncbi:MAG: hypothetical protein V1845_02805 [bacterium]
MTTAKPLREQALGRMSLRFARNRQQASGSAFFCATEAFLWRVHVHSQTSVLKSRILTCPLSGGGLLAQGRSA